MMTFAKHTISIMTACSLLLGIGSCSQAVTNAENIATAREYIDAAQYGAAQSVCDHMREKIYKNPQPADASSLAELSLLYMRIADADDRQDNVGFAYWCYKEAFRQDSAKAAEFYAATGVDDMALVSILNSISTIASRPDSIPEFADEADSLNVTLESNSK
ncbi:MAG: hypothetical protein NC343_00950 [Muribaculum sp.]|nr:hypothetical protein [Muribaculaceae bacterium]MCM1080303.1 hypothetical protein [Muribaculum sp.]